MKKICKKCGFIDVSEKEICPVCQKNEWEDYDIYQIKKISTDESFVNAMIKLKNENPIEYQLKMNQFELQRKQEKQLQKAEQKSNELHCPYCNSINVKRISTTTKIVNTAVFGIFGTKRHKQWHCNECNSDF